MEIEFAIGSAYSFSTTLQIEQQNERGIRFDANYETRPWDDAPYYDIKTTNRKAWELEFLHHKLYLTNNPSDVQNFEVTHGYNLLLFNRVWGVRNFDFRIGAGLVISRTESTIRGLTLNTTPELSGVSAQVAVSRRIHLSKKFFVNPEGKIIFSHASISVANGNAYVPNIALHALIGIGFDL